MGPVSSQRLQQVDSSTVCFLSCKQFPSLLSVSVWSRVTKEVFYLSQFKLFKFEISVCLLTNGTKNTTQLKRKHKRAPPGGQRWKHKWKQSTHTQLLQVWWSVQLSEHMRQSSCHSHCCSSNKVSHKRQELFLNIKYSKFVLP